MGRNDDRQAIRAVVTSALLRVTAADRSVNWLAYEQDIVLQRRQVTGC